MRTKFLMVVIGVLLSGAGNAALSTDIEQQKKKIQELIYRAQYDSAQVLTLEYLESQHLTDLDRVSVYLLYAETIRASGRPIEAVTAFKWALNLARMIPDNQLLLSRINMNIAGAYFGIPDYKLARRYAEESISISSDTLSASVGHATNYLIIGYDDYLNKNFSDAARYFRMAKAEYIKHDAYCEQPLYYTKMAELQNELGNRKLAYAMIDSSRTISAECEIMVYQLITENSLYLIHRRNKDFESAIESAEEIKRLEEEMRYHEQQMRMESIEKEFERKLQQSEIDNLQEISLKKEELLSKQRQMLTIAATAVILLSILLVLLIVAHRRRKRVMNQLEVLNNQLEEQVAQRTAHLVEANERIVQHSQTLSNQNKKLTDFYHIITHNLRAPLGNLSVLVELINNSSDTSAQQELLSALSPVVDNMNHTVNELLEAIQFSVHTETELKSVKFEDCLRTAMEGLSPQIQTTNATIKADFSGAPEVLYPEQHLVSLFHNLLSNSLKYKAELRDPQIQISSDTTGDGILLEFRDNGSGMDLEKYGHRLFQAGRVFHDHPDAKGYGLFMTKMQLENHEGSIRAESSPGVGTTFFVEFSK